MNSKHNTKTPAEKRTNQATTSTNVAAPSLHASAATDSTAATANTAATTTAATATTAASTSPARVNAETAIATTTAAVAAETASSTSANANDAFEEMPEEELLYELADLFKALSDTTRIRILCLLLGREFCVADIEHALGVSQSAVSHQLRLLKQAHLVKFRRDGKNIVYSLADDHVYTMIAQGMTHICE